MINHLKGKRIPVVRTNSAEETRRVLTNLSAVNCNVVELTFSIPNIDTYFNILKDEFPQMTLGLGTVTDINRARIAISVGAEFIVSPNFNQEVSDYINKEGSIYVPGCLTPTEIMHAYQSGHSLIKIFPGNLVGLDYVKTIHGLFPEVKILASGGVNHENVSDWEAVTWCTGLGGSYFKDMDSKTDAELQEMWKFLGETNE